MSSSTTQMLIQNPANKLSPAKRLQNQKPSCVLLVCVYDTIVFNITNDQIYARFEEFGNIIRLLIFQRKEVTKLFVEFEKESQAVKAKQTLDGKKLCDNLCKMSIYFSTFENVDLKHQTSQGVDFIQEKCVNMDQKSSFSNKSPTKNMDDFDQFEAFDSYGIHRLSNLPQNSFLPRSKTDVNQIQWHINKMKKQQSNWSGLLYIDQTIKSDIDSILNGQVESTQKWSVNTLFNQSPKKTPTPKIKNTQYKNENLTVLAFKTKTQLKHGYIYNLFSNFGNISLINIKRNEVRIKFRTVQFAAIAKNYLEGSWLYGNKIQLNSYPSNACYPDEGQYCEIICYDQTSDRFTPKKSITINPPSKVLHLSGLKKEKCTVYEINNIFRPIVEPSRIKILKQNSDKNMALVEFACLEDSFDAIAQCHNLVVGGRKVQISFTKSQI